MPESKQNYLRIENLTKHFGDFVAVQELSLEIHDGEFICFLGPSGCGKTTLLRAIAGLDPQSSGRITQAEKDISNLPPSQRDFGIVFQSYALFPNLTVFQNVAYGLENMKIPKPAIQKQVNDLLDLVGMPEQTDKYPAQLSGGQQQRVALARALATSPGLLLLDEPLSALDARVRATLRHEIRLLHERLGVTTILVTHDQEEALSMADRIVVMNEGRIEQVGTPEEIYSTPASPFVADFIGVMNFMQGEVSTSGKVLVGEKTLVCETGEIPHASKVRLTVRPEDIVCSAKAKDIINSFAVKVESLEFLGSFCRLILKGPEGFGELMTDLSTQQVHELNVSPGTALTAVFPARNLRVFQESS
ncbi:MAG: putative 2-aminoethylphosphonate ABC transporter ATP-binding protein [SAR324 cluster bacterium]|nr:putative 2-aminoethylphosphonate ABC transporter ATP-binding protein [SAR324 cluster bacterium]MBL7035691.1 putative 2-aminoethylphosphonate ABC transporter ATP-binding protein [SAR324 cluster bacterium]